MVDVWLSMVVVWWDILYETLYCLPPARASQPLETRPKVVDAEFEISQRFLPRRPVSSDRRDDQDDENDGGEGDRDLEILERALFKSERSANSQKSPTH